MLAVLILTAIVHPCISYLSLYKGNNIVRHGRLGVFMHEKLLRVSVNVNDLIKSKEFYETTLSGLSSQVLGDKSSVILHGSSDSSDLGLQLVQSSDTIKHSNGYLGLGIHVSNAVDAVDRSFMLGSEVITELGDYAYGASEIPDEDEMKQYPVRYGRILDNSGYRIELTERSSETSISKIVLGVLDLNDSIEFYTKVLQMKLLRRRANINSVPKSASMCAYCGYADEKKGPIIELYYAYATENVDPGTGINEIVIGTTDIDFSRKHIESCGNSVISTDSSGGFTLRDPNGILIKVEAINVKLN